MEPPVVATTTGIYCKTCGYDLRASAEARRCPECGRVFSPGDPTTFRTRPLGEWQRTLGRWAKRTAILLLVLAVLLAGIWGWFYLGWRQDRAVLAQVGGTQDTWDPDAWLPTILGGDPGRWLYRCGFPGGFVLERVGKVKLPATATAADLRALRKLRWMRVLDLRDAKITDAGLATLHDLPQLESLALSTGSFTDAGLASLAGLTQLQRLYLDGTPLTDAGLVHLTSLGKLRRLSLQGTRVTDAGLVHLTSLGALRRLNLRNTRVTDAGLVHLAKLTALNQLDLERTAVTDAGLAHLTGLAALRYLNLLHTRITPAGAARLKAVLPACVIEGP